MSDIATKLTYLGETKTEIKDAINLMGTNITNDTFRSYPDKIKDGLLDIMNNGTDTVWNNWEKVTGTGTDVTLNNVVQAPMKIDVKGRSKQETTEGNQLVDFNNMNKTGSTTYTFTNDILTISSSGTSKNINTDITDLVKNNAGKTLKFVYDTIDVSNQYGTNVVYLSKTENGTGSIERLLSHSLANTPYTIPADTSNITEVIFRVVTNGYSSTSYDASLTVTKPMLQFGTEEKTYEPYTGGASPNPDYSQAINSVGDNVNLFDKNTSNILNAYLSSSTITSGSGQRTIYIPITGGKTYTISKILSTRFRAGTTADAPDVGSTCIDYVADNIAEKITINTSSSANYLCAFVYNPSSDTKTEQQILDSIKIEENSQATPYSPYNMGVATIEKCNKNLLKGLKQGDINSTTGVETSSSSSVVSENYILYDTTNTYYLSNNGQGTSANLRFYNKNKEYIGYSSIGNSGGSNFNITKTTGVVDDTPKYFRIRSGTLATTDNVMISIDSNLTYVAHQSQTYSIYTQSPFRAIGDVRDDFAKIGGVWYERHKIGSVLLDGTETNWVFKAQSANYYGVKIEISNMIATNSYTYSNPGIISNFFIPERFSNVGNAVINGIARYNGTSAANKTLYFSIDRTLLADATVAAWKTWLSTHNTEVIYVLSEPTLTECTDEQVEQLEAISQAKSYAGQTNIFSDDVIEPWLECVALKNI